MRIIIHRTERAVQISRAFFCGLILLLLPSAISFGQSIELTPIGTYATGIYASGAAEIVTHDPGSQRLFVVNASAQAIDVLDISDPTNPGLLFAIDLTPYGKQANSVDAHNGIVVAAVENDSTQLPGKVVFFDIDGNYINDVPVGALPDMVTFTQNAKYVVVANEGEPNADYTHDPEGSVSVIRVNSIVDAVVKTADFHAYDNATLDPSIRIFGPGATVSQDLEPEYVTTDGKNAYVTCQENNALAIVNLSTATVTDLIGLGFKDYSSAGNGIDASNDDGAINIANWPVKGMYQPDAIADFKVGGTRYLITANEGDSREYEGTPGFVGETRVQDLTLDPTVFGDTASLQMDSNLGRLKVTITNGDIDNDGEYEELYSYGARSFSIRNTDGNLVFDSGDQLEQITALLEPDNFNSDDEENGSFDDRSDDKGPEPEGVTTAKIGGRHYAFIGLERVGGIMVYDVTDPYAPVHVQYINTRDFNGDPLNGTAGDMSPEGLIFIPKSESPSNKPLLVVSFEVSGSTTIFEINKVGSETLSPATESAEVDNMLTTDRFALEQNYPNPFNPETTINYQLASAGEVSISIYDLLGRPVKALAVDSWQSAGQHTIQWDGTNDTGESVVSGTYFYRFEAENFVSIKRMQLVR